MLYFQFLLWKLRAKTQKSVVQAKIIHIWIKSKGKSAPQAKNFEVFNIRNTIFNSFSFKSNTKSWKFFRLRRDSLNPSVFHTKTQYPLNPSDFSLNPSNLQTPPHPPGGYVEILSIVDKKHDFSTIFQKSLYFQI